MMKNYCHLTNRLTISGLVAIVLLFVQSLQAQNPPIVTKQVDIETSADTESISVTLPASLAKNLDRISILSELKPPVLLPRKPIIQKLVESSLVRVGQHHNSIPVENEDGTFTARSVYHQAFFPGIMYKNHLYIFTEGDSIADREIFDRFIASSSLQVKNENEALALVNFFLAGTLGFYANEAKMVLSAFNQIPAYYRERRGTGVNCLTERIRSPQTRIVGTAFHVELFTWQAMVGEVYEWEFVILPDGTFTAKKNLIERL